MKRILTIFTMIGFIFVLTGCVDEDAFLAMQESITNLESEVTSLQEQLDTTETNLGLSEAKIAELETALATEQADLDAAELALATAQAGLTAAEAALATAQADITSTQADLDLAEAALATAQADLTAAQLDLEDAESAVILLATAHADLTWQIHEETTKVIGYALNGEIYFDLSASSDYYGTVHIYEGRLNDQPDGFEDTTPLRSGLGRTWVIWEAGYYNFTVVIYSKDFTEAPHYRNVEVIVGETLNATVEIYDGDFIIDFSNPNFDMDLVGYLPTPYDRFASPIPLDENIIYEYDMQAGDYIYTIIWQHVYDDGYSIYTEYHYEEFYIPIDPYFTIYSEVDFASRQATFDWLTNIDYASVDVYQEDALIATVDSSAGGTYTTPTIDIEGDILFSFDFKDESGNVIATEWALISIVLVTQYTTTNDGFVTFDFSGHDLGPDVVNYRIVELSDWMPFVYDLPAGETSMTVGGWIDGWVVTYELHYCDVEWNPIYIESITITFVNEVG